MKLFPVHVYLTKIRVGTLTLVLFYYFFMSVTLRLRNVEYVSLGAQVLLLVQVVFVSSCVDLLLKPSH